MKPNGLVLAASITSQTSMSSLWHIWAISFTRPMFTARNVFSRSFTISATRVELTGTTLHAGIVAGSTRVTELVRTADADGIQVTDVQVRRPTLDDVFLALTGRSLREADTATTGEGAAA